MLMVATLYYSPPWLGRHRWPPGVTSRVTANFRVITPINAGHPVGLVHMVDSKYGSPETAAL